MASNGLPPGTSLEDVMSQLQAIQQKQDELLAVVDSISHAGTHPSSVAGLRSSPLGPSSLHTESDTKNDDTAASSAAALASKSTATPPMRPVDSSPTQSGFTSRIILT